MKWNEHARELVISCQASGIPLTDLKSENRHGSICTLGKRWTRSFALLIASSLEPGKLTRWITGRNLTYLLRGKPGSVSLERET